MLYVCMHVCIYIYIIEYFYISHYCILCSGAVAECSGSRAMALRLSLRLGVESYRLSHPLKRTEDEAANGLGFRV